MSSARSSAASHQLSETLRALRQSLEEEQAGSEAMLAARASRVSTKTPKHTAVSSMASTTASSKKKKATKKAEVLGHAPDSSSSAIVRAPSAKRKTSVTTHAFAAPTSASTSYAPASPALAHSASAASQSTTKLKALQAERVQYLMELDPIDPVGTFATFDPRHYPHIVDVHQLVPVSMAQLEILNVYSQLVSQFDALRFTSMNVSGTNSFAHRIEEVIVTIGRMIEGALTSASEKNQWMHSLWHHWSVVAAEIHLLPTAMMDWLFDTFVMNFRTYVHHRAQTAQFLEGNLSTLPKDTLAFHRAQKMMRSRWTLWATLHGNNEMTIAEPAKRETILQHLVRHIDEAVRSGVITNDMCDCFSALTERNLTLMNTSHGKMIIRTLVSNMQHPQKHKKQQQPQQQTKVTKRQTRSRLVTAAGDYDNEDADASEREEQQIAQEEEEQQEKQLQQARFDKERDTKKDMHSRHQGWSAMTTQDSPRSRSVSPRSHSVSSQSVSPRLASPKLASPRSASPRSASPRSASPRSASPRSASPRSASPRQDTGDYATSYKSSGYRPTSYHLDDEDEVGRSSGAEDSGRQSPVSSTASGHKGRKHSAATTTKTPIAKISSRYDRAASPDRSEVSAAMSSAGEEEIDDEDSELQSPMDMYNHILDRLRAPSTRR